uniref:Coilin p80 n=2 Tax=Iconisemion striatum TaxID=60296 RepID=A0A1A7Z7B4_9TELE
MASSSNRFIRLRLLFDYPPPAVVGCRMCWLLVDLNACRVVADLESLIREKFEFSRGSILSLFVEECYLPHTESIYVVRDNDSVRVKVDCLSQVNGLGSCSVTSESCRKRQRDLVEAELGEEIPVKCKRKKKKRSKTNTAEVDNLFEAVDKNEKSKDKKCLKKKKMDKKRAAKQQAALKPAASPCKKPDCVDVVNKSTNKVTGSQVSKPNGPVSDSTSKKKKATKDNSSTFAPSKAASNPKPPPPKTQPSLSSSFEKDSCLDEANTVKLPPKSKLLTSPTTIHPAQSNNCSQKHPASIAEASCDKLMEPCNQDGEEDIQLVIKRPQQPAQSMASHSHWRGHVRTIDQPWADPGKGSGVEGNETDTQMDSVSNMSAPVQNGECVPKKDYSPMPLLAAPPQVGQKIAFKLLELTESYTPEISEYKEGTILNFDPITRQIELELLCPSQAPLEPGKFDLVYQNPDGSESVEYAVPRGSLITERWDSLLEPRLII